MNAELFRFQLGEFSCTVIRDEVARYPAAMFLTNLAREVYEPILVSQGQDLQQIELPYTCLLIENGGNRTLVDTGVGRYGSSHGKLPSLLQRAGIDAYEIETVILSHAHPDHIGGSLDANGKPAFPNARYVMLRREWEYWTSNPTLMELPLDGSFKESMRAFAQTNLSGIQPQLDLVEPDTEIVPGVLAIAAFGHSPGQMGLDISSAGDRLLFVADAVVLPLHLAYPDTIGATDHRPEEMVATRRKLLEKAAQHRCLVSTSHFAFPGLGYVAPNRSHWEWKASSEKTESHTAGL